MTDKKPGLRMEMRPAPPGLGGMRLELRQGLVMPPIANSLDEAVEQSKPHAPKFSNQILETISSYIKSEDRSQPYLDAEVAERLHNLGYFSITTIDIASARKTLGIKPAYERYTLTL